MNFVFTGLTLIAKVPIQFQVGPRIPITALPQAKGYFGIRCEVTVIIRK